MESSNHQYSNDKQGLENNVLSRENALVLSQAILDSESQTLSNDSCYNNMFEFDEEFLTCLDEAINLLQDSLSVEELWIPNELDHLAAAATLLDFSKGSCRYLENQKVTFHFFESSIHVILEKPKKKNFSIPAPPSSHGMILRTRKAVCYKV